MPEGDPSGRTFGDFRIVRRLGQGGMGAVYLAEQTSLKRKVALKLLRPELTADPAALQRFRAEAEAVARITHANIVQVYAVGEADGTPFMALEFVDGKTLREIVVRKGPPDLPVCVAIMKQVAAALQRASEAGLVHRDIKPENILVTRNVEVKVADFGLSRLLNQDQELHLTQTGMTMGTPLYMSPEQVRNRPLDPRSDIYSFGVTCYFMFAGQPPFHGTTPMEVALKHCEEEPPALSALRPDLPPQLCALVQRMMHKDPARRPQSGAEVLRELGNWERGEPAVSQSVVLDTATPTIVESSADTEMLAAPARAWRWTWIVFLGLAGVAAGAGVKYLKSRLAGPPGGYDDHPELPIVSNHERLLMLQVEESANPKPDKVREGLAYHVRLGVLYWEQSRLDEAKAFFADLQKRPNTPQQYTSLGYLGTAITLALRSDIADAAAATKMLQDLPARFPQYRAALLGGGLPPEDSINLKFWLTRALDRLAGPNGTLPRPLERLRDEASNRRPPGPPGKL